MKIQSIESKLLTEAKSDLDTADILMSKGGKCVETRVIFHTQQASEKIVKASYAHILEVMESLFKDQIYKDVIKAINTSISQFPPSQRVLLSALAEQMKKLRNWGHDPRKWGSHDPVSFILKDRTMISLRDSFVNVPMGIDNKRDLLINNYNYTTSQIEEFRSLIVNFVDVVNAYLENKKLANDCQIVEQYITQ